MIFKSMPQNWRIYQNSKRYQPHNQNAVVFGRLARLTALSQKTIELGKVARNGKPTKADTTIDTPPVFKWRHFQGEFIVLCLRWYLRYSLSYRDLEEMMAERGLKVDHSTIARWVLVYAPELEKRVKPQLKPTNDSWKVDETYIKVKGEWLYQYRAVDSDGQTIEFFFSTKRDAVAAEGFFETALEAGHTVTPRVINVDKNAAYPKAVEALKTIQQLPPIASCAKSNTSIT